MTNNFRLVQNYCAQLPTEPCIEPSNKTNLAASSMTTHDIQDDRIKHQPLVSPFQAMTSPVAQQIKEFESCKRFQFLSFFESLKESSFKLFPQLLNQKSSKRKKESQLFTQHSTFFFLILLSGKTCFLFKKKLFSTFSCKKV